MTGDKSKRNSAATQEKHLLYLGWVLTVGKVTSREQQATGSPNEEAKLVVREAQVEASRWRVAYGNVDREKENASNRRHREGRDWR
jgi:hypothetical protein